MATANQLKIIVNGAHGKMGEEAVIAINNDEHLNLVAGLDSSDNLAEAIKDTNADVVVDLTSATSVYINTKTIIINKASPVIGSSGLTEEQILELQSFSKKLNVSGLIVPNFSLGAVLMMQFAETAAKFYQQVEIIERHHPHKLDAPSGTAIRTAELMSKHINNRTIHNSKSKESMPGALGANCKNIPIHSLRLSGSCAHQTVVFGGNDETLSITHDSMHRKCFMPGVVLACKKVKYLKGLEVGLDKILDLG